MSEMKPFHGQPLIVLDLQRAIDHPSWGVRNNPDAENRISGLLAVWRQNAWPIIHIKHDSMSPTSTYYHGQIGNKFKPEVEPHSGEIIISKSTHSAFIEPALSQALAKLDARAFLLVGVKTNNSIETTVRHGSNLGYAITLLEDGCFTHDQTDWNGKHWSAEDVHAFTLSNLSGEYCQIATTKDVLRQITP